MRAKTWQLLHELWAKHSCMRAAEGAPLSEIEAAAMRLEMCCPRTTSSLYIESAVRWSAHTRYTAFAWPR
jgi:hypothetical protein